MFTVNKNPSATDLRKFGNAMLFGFAALAVLLWILPAWKGGTAALAWSGRSSQIMAIVFAALGFGLFTLSRVSLAVTKTVYIGWMSAAVPIGIVMSTIALSLLYFILLPVFSLIVRRSDPLRRKLTRSGTYWEEYRHYEPTLERMHRQF